MFIAVPYFMLAEGQGDKFNNIVSLQIEAEIYGDYAIHRRHIFNSATTEITINEDVYVVSHVEAGTGLCGYEQKFRALAYVEAMQELVPKYGGTVTPHIQDRDGHEFTLYLPDDNFIKAHREAKDIADNAKRKSKKETQAELQGSLFA